MNRKNKSPIAVVAENTPARKKPSVYPEPFASMMTGREKHPLGDLFGIKKFGINLTRLAPGAQSALLHRHSLQEEFIFILEGQPLLVTDIDELQLQPGMCAGFTPDGVAHKLVNRTSDDVIYLEIGDRTEGDKVNYPHDDLVAIFDTNGQWQFSRKNGESY
ncbi:Cupin domain protein [Legionella santicrucis]|uniref:Cupin domain protein n=1 Tax=Legionella santicrucis TaxID=45074 RepID=A0A0W0YFI9_9GAMM|nr:cupin domain-containing protein [Legionella santicrucis]KTD55575.1 Cupin domain protein [Legionella santicrucis]